MDRTLELIDRFFQIMLSSGTATNPENKNAERLNSEWTYLLNLLKTTPVAYDRIEAYLNILESTGSTTGKKKKGRRSQQAEMEHSEAKRMLAAV